MSDISGISPLNAQNNAQKTNSSGTSAGNPSAVDESNANLQNISALLQSIPTPDYSVSLESLSSMLSNLQAVENDGVLKNNPTLAESVINSTDSTNSTPTLESLSSELSDPQAFENANALQNNSISSQSVLPAYLSAYNSDTTNQPSNPTGSSVNTTG